MLADLEPNSFHDGIIQQLFLNFEAQQILLVVKQWNHPDSNYFTISNLIFEGVAWQNFEEFNSFNCLFDIQVSTSFKEFVEFKKDYLAKMNGYLPYGTLEAIEADASLKYYFLNSAVGFDGFVICKSLSITETQHSQTADN